ncbi:hypothetical protein T4C_2686 [Trichinella pseudospiralis]|uniref:Uncharacterized protein n=1 Tax=Trichinella pseudospiralis TaxID=6337 RepID=A0A0V1GMD8_TRIPS|nr:hypothetical protein T4C_2686 [Trichinella pseudospiralis]
MNKSFEFRRHCFLIELCLSHFKVCIIKPNTTSEGHSVK